MRRLFLLALLLPSSAFAQSRWFSILNNEQIEISIDTTSITADSGKVAVWVRYDYSQVQYANDTAYKTTNSEWRFDCARRRGMPIATASYTLDGTAFHTARDPEAQLSDLFPDSQGEVIWKQACEIAKKEHLIGSESKQK